MKLTFLFKPNLFLSKRTKALVVITITVLLLLLITLGLVLETVCDLGWIACAGSPIDVILCHLLLSRNVVSVHLFRSLLRSRLSGCHATLPRFFRGSVA